MQIIKLDVLIHDEYLLKFINDYNNKFKGYSKIINKGDNNV